MPYRYRKSLSYRYPERSSHNICPNPAVLPRWYNSRSETAFQILSDFLPSAPAYFSHHHRQLFSFFSPFLRSRKRELEDGEMGMSSPSGRKWKPLKTPGSFLAQNRFLIRRKDPGVFFGGSQCLKRDWDLRMLPMTPRTSKGGSCGSAKLCRFPTRSLSNPTPVSYNYLNLQYLKWFWRG